MIIVNSAERDLNDLINRFNRESKNFKAKQLSFLFKNMSMFCKTIKIREKKLFGKTITIDYWDNEFFQTEIGDLPLIKKYEDMIKEFEKIIKMEVIVERGGF